MYDDECEVCPCCSSPLDRGEKECPQCGEEVVATSYDGAVDEEYGME